MHNIKKILMTVLMLLLVFSLSACFSDDNQSGSDGSNAAVQSTEDKNDDSNVIIEDDEIMEMHEGDGVFHEEEVDGAEITKVDSDPSRFLGEWEGTSDKAVLLYGNVELNIRKGGSWTGNITDEKLSGKWEDKGGYLRMNSEVFTFDLVFDDAGNLLLVESDGTNNMYTVLTKK